MLFRSYSWSGTLHDLDCRQDQERREQDAGDAEESARGVDRPVEASVAVAGLHSTASFLLFPTATLFLSLSDSHGQRGIGVFIVSKALSWLAMAPIRLAGSSSRAPYGVVNGFLIDSGAGEY